MKIINKIFFILMLSLLIMSMVYAVDDQAILQVKIREALQYEQRGNSREAEKLYKQLLGEFQHNRQIINRLVYLYLRTNDLNGLETLLENEHDYLPLNYYGIIKIELLIKKNEIDKAHSLADSILVEAGGNALLTKQVGQLYQRYGFNADAVDLYLRARNRSKNETLFAQELAGVYQAMGRHYDALDEYIRILDGRTYQNVRYLVEKLDLSDDEILEALQRQFQIKPSIELQELIGEFYIHSKQFEKAFDLYKTLGNDALIKLSMIAEKQELYELSIQCLKEVLKTTEDVQAILYLENKIGKFYYLNNDYTQADSHYRKVIDIFKNTNATLPNNLIFQAYKNLALIELFDYKNPVNSQKYLEKALSYASNNNEKANLSIMLTDCYLQQEDYVSCEKLLHEILLNKYYNQDIKEMAKLQLIYTMLFKGDIVQVDSLAKTFLTHDYESIYANNVAELYRTINNELYLTQANDSVKSAITSLLRNMYFNNSDIVKSDLEKLSSTLQDSVQISFIRLKIADYYYENGDFINASAFYSGLLEDEQNPFREYLYFRVGNCFNELGLYEKAYFYYTDYLLAFPQGTFAPAIRKIIKE